jgi:hypothetical protein
VRVFLDTSVLLAASGSAKGASRYIVENALAENCDVLLTLDRAAFHGKLGDQFYAILIRTPGDWLLELRDQGLI